MSENGNCRVMGLKNRQHAYIWISDPKASWYSQIVEDKSPQTMVNELLKIKGFDQEIYTIQWWNTKQGGLIKEDITKVQNDAIELTIPNFKSDIACKIQPAED